MRKLLCEIGWSYHRGPKLDIRRSAEEPARVVLETEETFAKYAESGALVVPLGGDQSTVYVEATLARRWNPVGPQPVVADGARSNQAENIYGAIHRTSTARFILERAHRRVASVLTGQIRTPPSRGWS